MCKCKKCCKKDKNFGPKKEHHKKCSWLVLSSQDYFGGSYLGSGCIKTKKKFVTKSKCDPYPTHNNNCYEQTASYEKCKNFVPNYSKCCE